MDGGGIVQRERMIEVIPNLAATHPDTEFQVWREYKPILDIIEVTVFYREPGEEKMRIDAVLTPSYSPEVEIMPQDVKIIQWGNAVRSMK